MAKFWVNVLFGAKSRRGFVQLHYEDWTLQVETEAARKIAHDIVEAAEAADQDAFLVDFMMQRVGVTGSQAGQLLQEFREWRAQKRRAHDEQRERADESPAGSDPTSGRDPGA